MNTPLWTKYGLDPNTGDPPMAMDYRHVAMLHAAILKAKPRTAVEIGSHKGHSLVAFLEAMDELPEMELHVFEPHITPELTAAIYASGHSQRVTARPWSVWDSDLKPDLVFIDGDHGLPALADLAWCLARMVPVIAMHDTRTKCRIRECWGAAVAANLLRDMPSRKWWEDHEDRPGEWTWRGFGVSTIFQNQP